MIGIIDYGAGNLKSVCNALEHLGFGFKVFASPEGLEDCGKLILPGVGAFPSAMEALDKRGFVGPIRAIAGSRPFLGICLGMQLLFEEGFEFSRCEGLGLIPGRVERIKDTGLRIPHVGWNGLDIKQKSPLLEGLEDGDCCYFVHSYMAATEAEYIAASCGYGVEVPALVQRGNIFGAQFHPEKSSLVGIKILENFGRV